MSRFVAALVVVLATACAEPVPVEVTVHAPAEPPVGASVLVTAGDLPEVTLTKQSATTFTGTVEIPDGKTVNVGTRLSTAGAGLDAQWNVIAVPVTADADADPPQTVTLDVARWDIVVPAGSTRVRFAVTLPDTSPLNPTVYVSGPSPALGSGRAKGVELMRASDGRYVGEAALPAAQEAQYAYNLGTSDNFERTADNGTVTRRLTPVGASMLVEDVVDRWARQTLTGNIHVHHLEWAGKAGPRRIIVYLPPGYVADTTTRYPVLYMHDGQNLMDTLTGAPYGEWGVDEAAEELIAAKTIEPLIIVGVYHGYELRIAEYTYLPNPPYGGGEAEDYRQFLTGVVKPFVDATYRTKPEAQYTGAAGSSLGGLVSMWLGLVDPDVFTRLGVISPSVWWANRDIVTRVNALESKPPLRIWLDMGTGEGTEAVTDARLLRDALVAEGWVLDTDLRYHEAIGAAHNEGAWRARFREVLKWLYPAQ